MRTARPTSPASTRRPGHAPKGSPMLAHRLVRLVVVLAATGLALGTVTVAVDLAGSGPHRAAPAQPSVGDAVELDTPAAVRARGSADTAVRPVGTDGVDEAGSVCPRGFEASPAAGCIREVGPGLSEAAQPDGEVVTVATPHAHAADDGEDAHRAHGHDDAASADRAGDAGVFAATSSWALDDLGTRPVVCAPSGTPRTVAVHAHLEGRARDAAGVRRDVRSVVERSNALVATSARASGGPVADLRLACDGRGAIAVRSLVVPGPEYGQVRQAALDAGLDLAHEKYLVFADMASPDRAISGMAQRYADDRQVLDNHNNGVAAMHGVVWWGHWDGIVPIHELTHMMGGIQADAPGSDGAGHCTDAREIMCPTASPGSCAGYAYDCGHDSYFSTAPAPGSYLDTHWNIGWTGNRFVDVAGEHAEPDPEEPRGDAPADDDESARESDRDEDDRDEGDAEQDPGPAGAVTGDLVRTTVEVVEAVGSSLGAGADDTQEGDAGGLVGRGLRGLGAATSLGAGN